MTSAKLLFQNCTNNMPPKQTTSFHPSSLCFDKDFIHITRPFSNLCRCPNGLSGFTYTGSKDDCRCYPKLPEHFTFFDNFAGDVILEKVILIRTIIIVILLIPLIHSFSKMKMDTVYFANKGYEIGNRRLVPGLFGILFIYTLYLLYGYFKSI